METLFIALLVFFSLGSHVTSSPVALKQRPSAVDVGKALEAISSEIRLDWYTCRRDDGDKSVECANMTVPLDWENPDKSQVISIALARLPCKEKDSRDGAIFFNPGGPGEAIGAIRDSFSDESRKRFDIVTMDPRGTGASPGLDCMREIGPNCTTWPTTQEEYHTKIDCIREVIRECEGRQPLIRYMDSISIALDVEAVRLALGEEKLNFMGASYGSRLATAYLELFPYNIHRMVMDGVCDHTSPAFTQLKDQFTTDETRITRYTNWCKMNESCPFTAPNASETIHSAIRLTGRNASCLMELLYDTLEVENYTLATDILQDTLHDPSLAGRFPTCDPWRPQSRISMDFLAIECSDNPVENMTFPLLTEQQKTLERLAPTLSHMRGWKDVYFACAAWPFPSRNPPHRLEFPFDARSTEPQVMLLNSLLDMSTPLAGAKSVWHQIPGSIMVTTQVAGKEHTSYPYHGEAMRAVDGFFKNGSHPKNGGVIHGW